MLSVYGKVRFVVNKDMINTRGEEVNPLSLLTTFAASSPKGAPLGTTGKFAAAAKSRPLGEGGIAAGDDGRGSFPLLAKKITISGSARPQKPKICITACFNALKKVQNR